MKTSILGVCLLVFGLACTSCTPAPIIEDLTKPGEVCEVHKIPLRTGEVPIQYGLPSGLGGPMIEVEQKYFPNACSSISAGKCTKDESKLIAKVSYCPECRKAEAAWKQQDKKNGDRQWAVICALVLHPLL